MAFPVPPFGAGPQIPPTTTGTYREPYPAPPWQPPFARPAPAMNSLLTAGAGLAILGGFVIAIGWLVDIAQWVYIVGFGWMMFGPGVGIALLGLAKEIHSR
jgi:hypothetical protein